MNDTGYPLELLGERDTKYGGTITDVTKLSVGTKFFVCNGGWYGSICQDENCKYIKIENHNRMFKLDERRPYLLAIKIETN